MRLTLRTSAAATSAVAAVTLMMILAACLSAGPAWAGPAKSKGQTLYVAAYSYVYLNEKGYAYDLTKTLVIRNTDTEAAITVRSVEYYDLKGKLVKHIIEKPITLAPLASIQFAVQESKNQRGGAPCMLVRWRSNKPVNPPRVECVMIGAQGQQGISFTSQGVPID